MKEKTLFLSVGNVNKRNLIIAFVVLMFLVYQPGFADSRLQKHVGKVVRIEVCYGTHEVGILEKVDGENLYLKEAKELKWVKQYIKNNKDKKYSAPPKEHSLSIEKFSKMFIVEEGKPDLIVWVKDLYMPSSKKKASSDPNADLRKSSTPEFQVKTLGYIRQATGWRKNSEGEWVSKDKAIPAKKKNHDSWHEGDDRFVFYRFFKITHKGTTRYCIQRQDKGSTYKYTHLEMGQKTNYSNIYWFISFEELKAQWKNLQDGKPNLIKLKVQYYKSLSGDDNTIEKRLREYPESFDETASDKDYFYIHVRPFKERKIVQFLIFWRFKQGWGADKENVSTGGLSFRFRPPGEIVLTEKLFDYGYYEANYDYFNLFLNLDGELPE